MRDRVRLGIGTSIQPLTRIGAGVRRCGVDRRAVAGWGAGPGRRGRAFGVETAWVGALAGRVAALAGLYLLPGLALLRLLWPRDRALVLPARLALALGVSVALPPLLLLLFHLIHLPWGAAATWAYLLLACDLSWC